MSDRVHVALLIETSLAPEREILRGIARYLREQRPWSPSHEPQGLSDGVPSWLRHWRGDGIIARIQSERMAQEIRTTGLPVVDVLGAVPGLQFPLVHVDHGAIGRMAAEHLLERGLRHFGYFGVPGENGSRQRYEAFQRAVLGSGSAVSSCELPFHPLNLLSCDHMTDFVTQWVAALPKPAGVFVCRDQLGRVFMEACRKAAVSIPDEVAVVSVDNDDPLCELCDPPLSSIHTGHEAVGYRAAAVLESVLTGGRAPSRPILIEPEQVVTRPSSDVMTVEDPAIAQALRLIRKRAPGGLQVQEIAYHVGSVP